MTKLHNKLHGGRFQRQWHRFDPLNKGAGGVAPALVLSLNFLLASVSSGAINADGGLTEIGFSRGSTATYWDEDGVLQTASSNIARAGDTNRKPVTNLLSYPEQFNRSPWSTTRASVSSGQADPFGGNNAFKLIEDTTSANNHQVNYGPVSFKAGVTYTFSIYAAAAERNWLRITVDANSFPNNNNAHFDLTAGEKGVISIDVEDSGIVAVEGTSFYRCWFTITADATSTDSFRILIGETDNDITYTGDGSSGLYIFGAMLNEGGIEDYIGATNLLTNDKDFSAWSTNANTDVSNTNTAVAPDGTTTADTIVDDGGGGTSTTVRAFAAVTLPAAGTYRVSVFAKANGHSWFKFQEVSFDSNSLVYYNLSNGTIGTDTAEDSGIVYWGNGWYLCWMEFSSASDLTGQIRFQVAQGDNNDTVDRDGASSLYLWGAQLTQGSFRYPYVGMPQTGFVRAGYTSEVAATNLNEHSDDIASFSHPNGVTITDNVGIGPTGASTLDRLTIPDTTSTSHKVEDRSSISVAAGVDYVQSWYIRPGNWRYIYLTFRAKSNQWISVTFDIFTWTATTSTGSTSGTIVGYGLIPCSNGLIRVWLAGSTGADDVSGRFILGLDNDATNSHGTEGLTNWAGSGGEYVDVGGVQVEAGIFPTSYVPTSGSTASRSADAATITGSAFAAWFNGSAGTFVNESEYIWDGNTRNILEANDGSFNNRHMIRVDSGASIIAFVRSGGSTIAQPDTDAVVQSRSVFRAAYAYSVDDYAISANGSAVDTDTSGALPIGCTQLLIGEANSISHNIRTVDYYNYRQDDTTLRELSASNDDGTFWRDEKAAA